MFVVVLRNWSSSSFNYSILWLWVLAFARTTALIVLGYPITHPFEAELPRTPTAKLVKRYLCDRYWPKKARA